MVSVSVVRWLKSFCWVFCVGIICNNISFVVGLSFTSSVRINRRVGSCLERIK